MDRIELANVKERITVNKVKKQKDEGSSRSCRMFRPLL